MDKSQGKARGQHGWLGRSLIPSRTVKVVLAFKRGSADRKDSPEVSERMQQARSCCPAAVAVLFSALLRRAVAWTSQQQIGLTAAL